MTKKNLTILIIVVVVLGYFAAKAVYNAFLSEEQLIRKIFESVTDAANESETGAILEPLAEDFIATVEPEGFAMKKQDLRWFLVRWFMQHPYRKYRLTRAKIEIKGSRADCAVEGEMSEDSAKSSVSATVVLHKIDNEWKVIETKISHD